MPKIFDQQLIMDSLKYSRVISKGSLISNEAATELKECGIESLPLIEETILQMVQPIAKQKTDHNDLLVDFPGLLSTWIAYYRIAVREALEDRILRFLQSLDGPLLATALLAMEPIWSDTRRICLPPNLFEFVRVVSNRSADVAACVAQAQLSRVWKNPSS